MNDLTKTYTDIRQANGVSSYEVYKKKVKQLIEDNIPNVSFSKPFRVNESERLSLDKTKDRAVGLFEQKQNETEMQELFSVAKYLRKQIEKSSPWKYNGSVTSEHLVGDIIPTSLYIFIRWVLIGDSYEVQTENTECTIKQRILTLAQHLMYACLSKRQIDSNVSGEYNHAKEWPLQLSVGLTAHATFRSKDLIDFLHGLCISVTYKRVIAVETQIANQAIESMFSNDGVYVPRNFISDRHCFFAIDNCDFKEDTVDGKNTLHGTVTNIYQQCVSGDQCQELVIDSTEDQRMLDLPSTITNIEECFISANAKPDCNIFSSFPECENTACSPHELAWILATYFGYHVDNENIHNTDGPPTWSAFNSLVSKQLPLTRVGTPPLTNAPAHEYSTLFTLFKQMKRMNTILSGGTNTVISLDMGLYKPAQKMLMSKRHYLNDVVLRPGELHIVIAMLRTIGSYIDNSGIDVIWLHSGLYGQNTIRQILDGSHVKRGIKAHTTTLLALFCLYLDKFFEANEDLEYRNKSEALNNACSSLSGDSVQEALKSHLENLQTSDILKRLTHIDEKAKPMHRAFICYMHMVLIMMQFIRSVRTGDWALHLSSLQNFLKYFFAMDRQNYARMITLYLAEMHQLKETDPVLWNTFCEGNRVVNKSKVAFCALGADHALEQVNRCMKVAGGIKGITLNEKARARFFLVAPELSRLKCDSKANAQLEDKNGQKHYELTKSAKVKQTTNTQKMVTSIKEFTDPFSYEEEDIINIVTKAVMPENVSKDILSLSAIGQQTMEQFIQDRLLNKSLNFWDPLKKCSLKLWKHSLKEIRLPLGDKVLELKEDRGLFARMLIVANSRPEIELEKVISQFELSVVPRALFAADGTMLHCSDKSALMKILEALGTTNDDQTVGTAFNVDRQFSVAVVDAMAIVQMLDKPQWIKTCKDLSDHFIDKVSGKFKDYDEVNIIFDRYDIPRSLKTATRVRRLGQKQLISYHITDTTNIEKVQMKVLLSSPKTKDELSVYFSNALVCYAKTSRESYVIAFRDKVVSSIINVDYLASPQEEADTKLILHALDASKRGATAVDIFSCDTDVFVLCIRRYNQLSKNTCFVTGTGSKFRKVPLRPIVEALGEQKVNALPGFHAFSGADNTGSMAGKGKMSFWKAFLAARPDVQNVFTHLGLLELDKKST